MFRRLLFSAFFLATSATWAAPSLSVTADTTSDARPKSGISEIDSLPLHDWDAAKHSLSIPLTVGLSAVIPGGGQFYSGHPVRGSFLLGLESLLFGLSLYSYYVDLPRYDRQTGSMLDSADAAFDRMTHNPAQQADAQSDFEYWTSAARINASRRLQQADLANSELAWALGLHFYAITDAFEIAVKSHHSEPRKRSVQRAMWYGLAFPGGAQLYNERYGKFGMLWMAIGASAVSGWSRQNVVESLNRSVGTARIERSADFEKLDVDRTLYRKRRNQYYWGIALLYVYGVMDGMVDASLSDFDARNRYALGPGPTPLSMMASIHF